MGEKGERRQCGGGEGRREEVEAEEIVWVGEWRMRNEWSEGRCGGFENGVVCRRYEMGCVGVKVWV